MTRCPNRMLNRKARKLQQFGLPLRICLFERIY